MIRNSIKKLVKCLQRTFRLFSNTKRILKNNKHYFQFKEDKYIFLINGIFDYKFKKGKIIFFELKESKDNAFTIINAPSSVYIGMFGPLVDLTGVGTIQKLVHEHEFKEKLNRLLDNE